MTTITLPPEVVGPLAKEAGKRGTTPELLAIDCLRSFFIPKSKAGKPNEDETLFDFLSGYTGTIRNGEKITVPNSGANCS